MTIQRTHQIVYPSRTEQGYPGMVPRDGHLIGSMVAGVTRSTDGVIRLEVVADGEELGCKT